ncbi:MAG: hypothetical protein OEP95_15045, partial [Myxococcales bacterium]|nr:hypothetical protein [Myxococcales bacterium]
LATREKLDRYLTELSIDLPLDMQVDPAGALAQPLQVGAKRLGNRFAVLPMEGWDASADGRPTDLVRRRWERFGSSGAKLIWGGEAFAVRPGGAPTRISSPPTRRATAISPNSTRCWSARTKAAAKRARISSRGSSSPTRDALLAPPGIRRLASRFAIPCSTRESA